MNATGSIFFDISLPNATTWFYFSGLLAVALFFKFSRLLSMRNLDVVTLYLFAPGLLLLSDRLTDFWGYLWLLVASLFFVIRCFVDLALVRRPALGTNLDFSGMAWLAGALFISLIAVAVRQPGIPEDPGDTSSVPIDRLPSIGKKAIEPYAPPEVDDLRLRLWAERGLALVCHLSIVVGLVLIGWRHFGEVRAGMAAATFYLLLPYTFLLLPGSALGVGRWDHAFPMALVVWAIFCYRGPMWAGGFLGVAAGTAVFPIVLLPAWFSFYRGKGASRFLLSFVLWGALGSAILGTILWLNGELPSSLQSPWTTFDWQPWKRPAPDTPGFWQDVPSQREGRAQVAYRVPIFIAYVALVIMSGLWPTPKNLAHVLALSAAVLLGIQFWYADRGGVYVLWSLPLLLLMTFRPNLSTSEPPAPPTDDWVARLGRGLWGWANRFLRGTPEPVKTEA